MRNLVSTLVLACVLSLCLFAPGSADLLNDYRSAVKKGGHAEAVQLLLPLAEQGDAEAQVMLGVLYDAGKGVPESKATAVFWYTKAVEQGSANAMVLLGDKFRDGESLPQDYTAAVGLYQKAVALGNAGALAALGNMYLKGQGVPKDVAIALGLMSKAAEQNNYFAQASLGAMYAIGRGIPQDNVMAHMWFNLSAAQGYKKAFEARDKIARDMTSDQIAKAQLLAREWFLKK